MSFHRFRNRMFLSVAAAALCVLGSVAYAAFPAFECYTIDRIGNQMGQTSLVDIDKDGDGDIDICSKPWNGDEHIYLRSMLKESAAK